MTQRIHIDSQADDYITRAMKVGILTANLSGISPNDVKYKGILGLNVFSSLLGNYIANEIIGDNPDIPKEPMSGLIQGMFKSFCTDGSFDTIIRETLVMGGAEMMAGSISMSNIPSNPFIA